MEQLDSLGLFLLELSLCCVERICDQEGVGDAQTNRDDKEPRPFPASSKQSLPN